MKLIITLAILLTSAHFASAHVSSDISVSSDTSVDIDVQDGCNYSHDCSKKDYCSVVIGQSDYWGRCLPRGGLQVRKCEER